MQHLVLGAAQDYVADAVGALKHQLLGVAAVLPQAQVADEGDKSGEARHHAGGELYGESDAEASLPFFRRRRHLVSSSRRQLNRLFLDSRSKWNGLFLEDRQVLHGEMKDGKAHGDYHQRHGRFTPLWHIVYP